MRGLLTLAGVALAAYISGRRTGQVEGFHEGVGHMSRAFVAGVRRADR